MSFSLQCNTAIDLYLLNKNILYKNRNIIALIVSLLFAEYVKLTKNVLINKFIVPICVYILCTILLNICMPILINNNERKMLKEKCMLWINDPENKKVNTDNNIILLNLDSIKHYVKTRETFEPNDNSNNNSEKNSDFINQQQQQIQAKPIPGPQWNPDSAEQVQNRLNNGMYVNAHCAF
tara:strand:+ start:834 stop:1373 length:540 start_codon:yes stop_codon:yes gene_type:complete